MPRGGRRNGKPGASYGQRSDLNQPVRTAPGQPYGQATQQAQAQKALPLPATPSVSPAPSAPPTSPLPAPGMLTAPTARPGEPVTAGLPVGAGAGPEANLLGPGQADDQVLANLYRAYQQNQSPGLLTLINQAEQLRARH